MKKSYLFGSAGCILGALISIAIIIVLIVIVLVLLLIYGPAIFAILSA
jgi:hypothetical protein